MRAPWLLVLGLCACGVDPAPPDLPPGLLYGTYHVVLYTMSNCEQLSVTMSGAWSGCSLGGTTVQTSPERIELRNEGGYAEFIFSGFSGSPEAARAPVQGLCIPVSGGACRREGGSSSWTQESF